MPSGSKPGQTPNLAAIVKAEEQEIRQFQPVDYWTVEVDFRLFRSLCRQQERATLFPERRGRGGSRSRQEPDRPHHCRQYPRKA